MMGIILQIRLLMFIIFGLPLLLNDEVNLVVRKIKKVSLTSMYVFFAHLMQDYNPKAPKNPEKIK